MNKYPLSTKQFEELEKLAMNCELIVRDYRGNEHNPCIFITPERSYNSIAKVYVENIDGPYVIDPIDPENHQLKKIMEALSIIG